MRTHTPTFLPLLAAAGAGALLALSGCDSVNKQLGLGKNPPDEFRVVERAPLAIPPQFQLRPPAPGAERPQEGTAREQAAAAVFTREGEESQRRAQAFSDSPGLSSGERRLLARAGADEAPADIRQVVNRESQKLYEANDSLLQDLLFWQEPQPDGEVVDASAESKRIRENQALGDAVTQGETPTIKRKQRGALEGLF